MKNLLKLFQDNAGIAKHPINMVRNEAGTEATIYIYDVIDDYWGVSAMSVIAALHEVRDVDTLHVRINSPGGSIFEGRAIMAAIKSFAGKTVAHIDSLCASAATSIAVGCDEVVMSQGAFFMIHNASGLSWGDKTELRKTADLLEKIEQSIIADYVGKTDIDEQTIIDWMDDETWFNADEALKHGFVDRLEEEKSSDTKNAWNLAAYKKAPEALKKSTPTNVQPPPVDVTPEPVNDSMHRIQANRNKLALIQDL